MNLREVTIGRSRDCDIYLDERCKYASNLHGTIYYDGNQLMYKDRSSNGTMINNVSVHKRAVPISHGDLIMIAGHYQINWNQIDAFFPPVQQQPQVNTVGTLFAPPKPAAPTPVTPNSLSSWSWGAFALNWIWGLFNGCWWILIIQLALTVLAVVPIINIFSSIALIGLSITCGVKGHEWAWTHRSWNSVQDFEKTQNIWDKVGLILFCISIVSVIGSIGLVLSMAARL